MTLLKSVGIPFAQLAEDKTELEHFFLSLMTLCALKYQVEKV